MFDSSSQDISPVLPNFTANKDPILRIKAITLVFSLFVLLSSPLTTSTLKTSFYFPEHIISFPSQLVNLSCQDRYLRAWLVTPSETYSATTSIAWAKLGASRTTTGALSTSTSQSGRSLKQEGLWWLSGVTPPTPRFILHSLGYKSGALGTNLIGKGDNKTRSFLGGRGEGSTEHGQTYQPGSASFS